MRYTGWGAARSRTSDVVDLTRCPDPACPGTKCQPARWRDLDPGGWCLVRRCPDCNRWWHGHHSHENVVRYDEALQAGTDRLISDLEQVTRRNQAEWSARFIHALRHDHIEPMDFGHPTTKGTQ